MGLPTLCIRLLGPLDLRQGDIPLPPLESARAQSLLAYLLLRSSVPQPRQRLAFLLWPDSTDSQARTNLRHLLHTLRHALPDADRFVNATSRTLQWRADAPVWLDVVGFEEAIARAERGADVDVASLREAVALYTGDLLEGCYDEWVLVERDRLRTRYLEALARLTELLEAAGEHAEAIRYANQLLRHDPIREETYQLLMRLHDARGDRARAIHVYHLCATTLERELGVNPAPATREVYEALLPVDPEPTAPKRKDGRLSRPPFVGRGPERSRLARLWLAAEAGRAQLVLITGEPGVGKTRLVEEFRSWCVHRGAASVEARSYPAEGSLSYGPVVAWLRSEEVEAHLDRIERAHLTELARLLPELLTTVPELAQPEPLPQGDQRQRLFDALARAISAPVAPLLLIADDLHWCDRETLQFLHYLLRADPDARLLVAATARHEDIEHRHPLNELVAGLHSLDRCSEIQLERLTRAETAALAQRMAGRPIEEPDIHRLYRETEGSPLFVVEALRAGWQSGGAGLGWMSPKVQAAIQARLSQLSDQARDLVGLAATIGRAFTTEVLADVSEADADTLVRGLDELWRRRIIREQGAGTYDFTHDKIREVAYLGLSPARRRQMHVRIAQVLEQRHFHDPMSISGQLAVHYERAGIADQAVTWYGRAAEAAQQLHANVEAVRLLDQALDLLRTLPANRERQVRELALLAGLLTPLGLAEGWASERLNDVQQRALSLARVLGVEPEPPLLRSLAIASLSRRDFAAAHSFGKWLHACGERDADDILLVQADYVLGIAAFWQGEFESARRHFEAAVQRCRPEHRRVHLLRYGLDPKVICLSRLGNTLWFLGQPESATRMRDAALTLADEIEHPFSLATSLVFTVLLALEMRDSERVLAYAAMLAARTGDDGTGPTRVSIEAIGGYIDVLNGREEAGIARIQCALDEAEARGADHAPGQRAILVRLLLEASAEAGDAQTGLKTADRALEMGSADRVWEAETRRLRAEFLTALGAPTEDVEVELARALDVARGQGAKMLELRAANSLLQLRLEYGDGPAAREARNLLAGIVASLPEVGNSQEASKAATLLRQN